MSSSKPTLDFKVTEEEKKYLLAERERKAQEEKKEAMKKRLRLRRNEAAIVNKDRLEDGIVAVRDSFFTLTAEIADRNAEMNEDPLWRREQHEIGAVVKATSGFTAAQNLKKLCQAISIGLGALIEVAGTGVLNDNTDGFEKSATLMSTCRAIPEVGANVASALEEMGEIVSEFVKKPEEEAVEERDGKRKRV